jgi:hypothetical protein
MESAVIKFLPVMTRIKLIVVNSFAVEGLEEKPKNQNVYSIAESSYFAIGLYLEGFTSTSRGSNESFLLHLGHFPSY